MSPSIPSTRLIGSEAGFGNAISSISPVVGSSRPTRPAVISVNQSAPWIHLITMGPEAGEGKGYSVIALVA
jgi:hypothetical protein